MWIEHEDKVYCFLENRNCKHVSKCCGYCSQKHCNFRCTDSPKTCKYLTNCTNELVNYAKKQTKSTLPNKVEANATEVLIKTDIIKQRKHIPNKIKKKLI